jgi:hypothetical protein
MQHPLVDIQKFVVELVLKGGLVALGFSPVY